jgi:citrate lyase subunit alpha / citrate CoA-transferase
MINAVARDIPDHIPGYPSIKPFRGASAASDIAMSPLQSKSHPGSPRGKLLPSIASALDVCELRDGATISFHHHLRNGDGVLNAVLGEIARRGLRGLKVAASSLFPVHAPLVEHIRSGVVTGISATYIAGPVGEAIARGELAEPVRMLTHGGRARAIEAGELQIDVAFVAAPAADRCGNLNGVEGPAACGTLGYALVDVRHARRVVAVTDHLVRYPACPAQITQDLVDYVVKVTFQGFPAFRNLFTDVIDRFHPSKCDSEPVRKFPGICPCCAHVPLPCYGCREV